MELFLKDKVMTAILDTGVMRHFINCNEFQDSRSYHSTVVSCFLISFDAEG